MLEKQPDGLKSNEDLVRIDLPERILSILLDLMGSSSPATIMTLKNVNDITAVLVILAIEKYQVTSLDDVVNNRMATLLKRPLDTLKLASDLDNVPLAKRSLENTTIGDFAKVYQTDDKGERYLGGLRPEWRVEVYRILLRALTPSGRTLGSGVSPSIKLDPSSFSPSLPDDAVRPVEGLPTSPLVSSSSTMQG